MTMLHFAQALGAASIYWYLVPLVLVVSVVYSATRHEEWSLIWWRAAKLSFYILLFMAVTLAGLWALQRL